MWNRLHGPVESFIHAQVVLLRGLEAFKNSGAGGSVMFANLHGPTTGAESLGRHRDSSETCQVASPYLPVP